jgi:hypothetical protein
MGQPPSLPRARRDRHGPAELGINWFDDVTLMPLGANADGGIGFRLGVFLADGTPIEAARHRRGPVATPVPPLRRAEESWEGSFVYAGIMWDHFGHFLVEGLARAWSFAQVPGVPLLWHRRTPSDRLLPWQRDILRLIGQGEREHRVVARPLRVARLGVPDPGLVMWGYLHALQAEMLAQHGFGAPVAGRRIWLSRSGLSPGLARIEGEEAVEATLATLGWVILRPETMALAQQLAAIEAAEVIAGFEGSAFHILMLGRDIRARVVILLRRERLNRNYRMIADAKGFKQTAIKVGLERLDGGKAHLKSVRLTQPQEALDALSDALGGAL